MNDDDHGWLFPSILDSIRTILKPDGERRKQLSRDMKEDWWWVHDEEDEFDVYRTRDGEAYGEGPVSKIAGRNLPPRRGGGVVIESD